LFESFENIAGLAGEERFVSFGDFLRQADGSVGAEDIEKLVTASDASIESLRTVIHDLRESPLGGSDLNQAIEGLVRNVRLDWKVKVRLELRALKISADIQIVIYQVAREALLNAVKHGKASAIWVRLFSVPHQAILEVEDNGIGFRTEGVDPTLHFGIRLLEERARNVAGRVEITSELDGGTKIRAVFPLDTA
jgi:signal transduction histidine kinase